MKRLFVHPGAVGKPGHEMLHRMGGQPARQRIVTEIRQPPRGQDLVNDPVNGGSHFPVYPGEDTVGHHVIAGGKGLVPAGQSHEIRLMKLDVGQAGAPHQASGMGDLLRVEVHAHKPHVGIGRRHHAQAQALAAAQLQHPGRRIRRFRSLEQRHPVQPVGGELLVKAVGVGCVRIIVSVASKNDGKRFKNGPEE